MFPKFVWDMSAKQPRTRNKPECLRRLSITRHCWSFAEEAVSQSMNVALQKLSKLLTAAETIFSAIILQFLMCGHTKLNFSISPRSISFWAHSSAVTSVHRGTEAQRGRKSSELTLGWDINFREHTGHEIYVSLERAFYSPFTGL